MKGKRKRRKENEEQIKRGRLTFNQKNNGRSELAANKKRRKKKEKEKEKKKKKKKLLLQSQSYNGGMHQEANGHSTRREWPQSHSLSPA